MSGTIVTRRAPPFHRLPSGEVVIANRGAILFVHPFFFSSSRGFFLGEPMFLAEQPTTIINAPFFCYLDGLGFSDRDSFVRHLHEVHGVPLTSALSFCERVGGRYMFFGL
jgi:hypothetical protein